MSQTDDEVSCHHLTLQDGKQYYCKDDLTVAQNILIELAISTNNKVRHGMSTTSNRYSAQAKQLMVGLTRGSLSLPATTFNLRLWIANLAMVICQL